jgi:tubulin alpha
MIDLMLDRIRKLADHCAGIQGFLIFCGFGGGTAAGFGCLLPGCLLIDSGKKSELNFNVYSPRQVSTTFVELSKCILGTSGMVDQYESVIMVDHVESAMTSITPNPP